jgi:hypothetical protein
MRGRRHMVKACTGKAATRSRLAQGRRPQHARATNAPASLGEVWRLAMARVRGLFGSLDCELLPASSRCGERLGRRSCTCLPSAGRDVLRVFDNMIQSDIASV